MPINAYMNDALNYSDMRLIIVFN